MSKRPTPEEFVSLIKDPNLQNQACFSAWEDSKNPYFVWEVIDRCAKHQLPWPDWVVPYLQECASRMMSDEAKQSRDVRKALPTILGFATKRGPGNLLDPEGNEPEGIAEFALHFAMALKDGLEPSQAMQNATAVLPAAEAERDEKTLWHWLKKYFGLTGVSQITADEWKYVTQAHYSYFHDFLLGKFREMAP